MMKNLIRLALILSTAFGGKPVGSNRKFGLYKPNLYFAVKDKSVSPIIAGLAWVVKDWRTNLLLVRYAL